MVGPRQVGKTTAIKILIHDLLKKENPKALFYYSCEELTDFRELSEVLDNYLSAKKEWGIKNSYIFLDEITSVEEWWRCIKLKIDKGDFRRDILVITGSTSLNLMKQKEYFPGRRGYGKDVQFFPLDFNEYAKTFGNLEIRETTISKLDSLISRMKANKIFERKLSELFSIYLKTGGFPIPIKEYFETGKISINSKKIYLDWLKNDWRKIGKNDKLMKEILRYILRAKLSPVSWLNISRETSLSSPHTSQDYVNTLEDLIVAKVLNLITPEGKVDYKKNKKIHILDPFLYHVISFYTGVGVLEEQIVESTVVSHLSRVSDVFYWKNKSEVDVVVLIKDKQVGFEVKWGFKKWSKPKHLKQCYLLTKDVVPLFLSSLNWIK